MTSSSITWDDISFGPVNLWVVSDVGYFYEAKRKENEMGKMKAMAIDMQEMDELVNFLTKLGEGPSEVRYVSSEEDEHCPCHDCSQEQPEQLELPFGDDTSAWEKQEGGEHYTNMPIQPFEFSMANNLDPMQHTIIKYVTRFRNKNGLKDLYKARHTLDMLIEWEEANENQ